MGTPSLTEVVVNKSIVFAGNIIVDSVKTLTTWPEVGMLATITGMKRSVGGSVSNTAIDLKTLDPSVRVRALGKVGAGDAFCADMLYSFLTGLPAEQGLRLASCAAAANLAASDSVSGALPLAETLALDDRFPRRSAI